MGDFSKLSNFNPDANFKLVRIGADSPVLEVELNEMQDISEQRYKDFIQYYIGDGVNGEGDFIYSNNKLTIQNETAFVKGNTVEITTLNLPLSEGQKAYLKVWEDTIKTGDLIRYKGNQQETRAIDNTILDDRIGRETSRRIQVKYDLVATTDNTADYLYLGKVEEGKFLIEAPTKTEETKIKIDRFISQGSQQVFVTSNRYTVGANALQVYIDGILQVPSVHFVELTPNSFRLLSSVEQGVEVVAIYHKAVLSKTKEGHAHIHSKEGTDSLDLLDLLDREGLVDTIRDLAKTRTLDCGNFNDHSTEIEEIYDGGVF